MAGSVILAGARTPIGKLSGRARRRSPPPSSAASPSRRRSSGPASPAEQVDYVFMGQVLQAGAGQITARQAAGQRRHPDDRARHHRSTRCACRASTPSTWPTR